MTKFDENNPEQLKEFLRKLNEIMDEFHPNIYTIDKVWRGFTIIENAISDELNK
jgi:Holliday junction resolvasome RuvABC endonuclease subunit